MIDNDSRLAFFAESELRREVLGLLQEVDKPIMSTTLTERSSGTRPTIHTTTEYLVDNGLAQRMADRRIELTVAGQLVARAYNRFCEQEDEQIFLVLTQKPTCAQTLQFLVESRDKQTDDNNSKQYYRSADINEIVRVSNSTVSRSLNECTDRGWIERSGHGQYAITAVGDQLIQTYEALEETVSWVTNNASCLNQFGRIDLGVDLPLDPLRSDITAIEAERKNPDAPFLYYKEQLVAARPPVLRGMLPAASLHADDVGEVLVDVGTSVELIMDEAAIEATQAAYPTQFRTICDDDWLQLFRYPSQIDIGIALFDERAALGAYDETTGHFNAILTSSAELFVEYVADIYEEHRQRSHDPFQETQCHP